MKENPVSFIRVWILEVQDIADFEAARNRALVRVEESYICKSSKARMKMVLTYQIHTKASLMSYLYNSLLTFEKMPVIH